MRLIDADKFKGKVIASHCYSGVNKLINVDDVPTAYDVDKVAKQLEELKAVRNLDKTNFSDGYNRAIDDFLKEADATFPMQSDGTAVLRRLEKISDRLKGGVSSE